VVCSPDGELGETLGGEPLIAQTQGWATCPGSTGSAVETPFNVPWPDLAQLVRSERPFRKVTFPIWFSGEGW
jgi:hypothetical protein